MHFETSELFKFIILVTFAFNFISISFNSVLIFIILILIIAPKTWKKWSSNLFYIIFYPLMSYGKLVVAVTSQLFHASPSYKLNLIRNVLKHY